MHFMTESTRISIPVTGPLPRQVHLSILTILAITLTAPRGAVLRLRLELIQIISIITVTSFRASCPSRVQHQWEWDQAGSLICMHQLAPKDQNFPT